MYLHKSFLLTPLPYTDIKTNIYSKVNNKVSLKVTSGGFGVPYGSIARLILLYITSELVKQGSNKIVLGKSFSNFMHRVGYLTSGGYNGNIERFKEQYKRIITCNYKIVDLQGNELSFNFIQSSNEFNGCLEVEESFYKHLLNNKIYVNGDELKSLQYGKYGSFTLDLYFYLIYRRYTLRKFTKLKYEDLQNQFGSKDKLANFKLKLKKSFLIIASVLNNLNTYFKEQQLNIVDLSIKEQAKAFKTTLYSYCNKIAKALHAISIKEKYKFTLEFEKTNLRISPTRKT